MHPKLTRQPVLPLSLSLFLLIACLSGPATAQIGIGTTTPAANSILDIQSTTKGVLIPRLTSAQQATLAGMLSGSEKGMLVTDAASGKLVQWNGQAWTDPSNMGAIPPLMVSATNRLSLNPGTQTGDLITWDGNNWVNMQPATQHFSFVVDNRQPYLVLNYCIALQGIFPSRADALPFLSEIELFGFTFAPKGWAFCNGQLLAISTNTALFSLLGTTYGGNGVSTFALPDLQGRVPIGMGQGPGLSLFSEGTNGGTESNTISR